MNTHDSIEILKSEEIKDEMLLNDLKGGGNTESNQTIKEVEDENACCTSNRGCNIN